MYDKQGKNFSTEQKLDTGLIATHAYSLTSVRDVKLGSGAAAFFKRDKIKMVRCRNPWGEKEWTGAWGDKLVLTSAGIHAVISR